MSVDAKKTQEIPQADVVAGLLNKLQDSVDRNHTETQGSLVALSQRIDTLERRVEKQSATDELLVYETQSLRKRMDELESDVRKARNSEIPKAHQRVSEVDLRRESDIASIVVAVEGVEQRIGRIEESVAKAATSVEALTSNVDALASKDIGLAVEFATVQEQNVQQMTELAKQRAEVVQLRAQVGELDGHVRSVVKLAQNKRVQALAFGALVIGGALWNAIERLVLR